MSEAGWDFDLDGDAGSSKKAEFTKFPVGITRIRVLDGVPDVRWTHFLNQFKRSVNCPGRGCPICEIRKNQKANKEPITYAMGRRFAVNVFNLETGKVEICEQGKGFFEDLRDLKDELQDKGKNLSDAIIKVKRRGTGKDDTSYRLDVESIDMLSPDERAKYEEDIIKLDEYFKPHTNEQILRLVKGEAWEDVMKTEDTETPATEESSTNATGEDEDFEVK